MSGLGDFRVQHPEYDSVPDGVLADKLYEKFYSSIPREQFDAKLGIAKPSAPQNTAQAVQANPVASGIETMALGMAKPALGLNSLLDKAVYGTGQLVTSAGGLYPNKVSNWMGEAAKSGDKLAAMLQRDAEGFQQASGQGPTKTAVLDIAGNIASPMNAALPLATDLAGAMGTGAAYGAMQPTKEGASPLEPVLNAGAGAAGGAAGYGLQKAVNAGANAAFSTAPAPKTTAQLRGSADYASFAQKPITLTPEAASALSDNVGKTAIQQAMEEAQINQEPHLVAEFQGLLNPGQAFHPNVVSTEAADKIRQAFDSLANDAGTPNAARGWSARSDAMETAIQQIPEINDARNTWAQFRKSEILDKVMTRATDAQGTPAGFGDSAQAIRREFLKLARSQKFNSFSPEEQKAITDVANGTLTTNTLQQLGKFSPIRGHLMRLIEMGGGALGVGAAGAVGSLPAIGLATVGEAARQGSNYATGRAARMASELVRRGGPAVPQLSPQVQGLVQALQSGTQVAGRIPPALMARLLADDSAGAPVGR